MTWWIKHYSVGYWSTNPMQKAMVGFYNPSMQTGKLKAQTVVFPPEVLASIARNSREDSSEKSGLKWYRQVRTNQKR